MSPLPRARYPSSSSASATSSTLFASSSASGSGSGTDGWMDRESLGGVRGSRGTRTGTSRSTATTPASLFSDNETEVQPPNPRSLGKVVYDGGEDEDEENDRPLIDFGDDTPRDLPARARAGAAATVPATPGEKLRLLLRQMEAEVRSTHTTTSTTASQVPAMVKEATPARSNWREGRRIGALPLERSYSPEPQSRGQAGEEGEKEEVLVDQAGPEDDDDEEVDSPPTPPLRITNPYLYASRKVSDERRSSSSTSPRKPSRAAVLHASTSRSPPPLLSPERPIQPIHQTPLQSYLARSRHSPSRKGKERSHGDVAAVTPQQAPRANASPRKPARTPRRWSVELAPDDSVIFAQGLASGQEEEVELDLDEGEGESVEPPWMAESSVGDDDDDDNGREVRDHEGNGIPDLPPPLDQSGKLESEDEHDKSMHALAPPASRSRSRFSQSPSFTTAVAPSPARHDQSGSFSSSRLSRASAIAPPSSESITRSPNASATHDRSTSFSRRHRPPPGVEPVPVPQPVRVPPSTPPRQTASAPAEGQTPRPPGAWFSASKPGLGRSPQVRFSPLRQAHLAPSSPKDSQDISIHRLKLSPAKPTSPRGPDADTSFTRRLVASILPMSNSRVPPPSTTLAKARSDLERAARETDHARRQVELTQTAWLQALSASGVTATATEVLRTSWSWGRWMWWITLEIMLLWGVFRVTLEYTSLSSASRLFDPLISAPSFALAVPLPTAISAFVIPSGHRRSGANFFDLLEQADLWRYLDKLGLAVLDVVAVDDPGGARARLSVPI